MDLIVYLLSQAAVVSWLVDLLKRAAVVAKYPRVAAAVLNVVLAVLVYAVDIPYAPEIRSFLEAVVAGFLAGLTSVGVHEAEPKFIRG